MALPKTTVQPTATNPVNPVNPVNPNTATKPIKVGSKLTGTLSAETLSQLRELGLFGQACPVKPKDLQSEVEPFQVSVNSLVEVRKGQSGNYANCSVRFVNPDDVAKFGNSPFNVAFRANDFENQAVLSLPTAVGEQVIIHVRQSSLDDSRCVCCLAA